MMKKAALCFLIFSFFYACRKENRSEVGKLNNSLPNIIVIYADDLGYGDLSAYGATALKTPNFDRIADEGIRFTNGYAASATCTPSRYALLTGTYPWRNKKAHILPGNAPLLVDPAKPSLPAMLKKAGYTTAVMGKWHLGLGETGMDWNGAIVPGPQQIGFDESFILASTNDRVPTVYVENDKVFGLHANDPLAVSYSKNFEGEPTGKENPELLKIHPTHGHNQSIHNGISRIGYMKGGKSALWVDEDMADTVLVRSQKFIRENRDKPFFLFYALHQPHVPRVPHPRFKGLSGQGPRGDAILEADWCVGELLNTLDELDLGENTLVVFSSDNGPVLNDGYQDRAVEKLGDHKPSGILRGGKYSLFDAGAHVPFMVRWPNRIQPGVSNALVCQMDLMASLAKLTGQPNKPNDGEDVLAALLGSSDVAREELVLEAAGRICFRKGDWVMIPPHPNKSAMMRFEKIETGLAPTYQLYNLREDPSQQNNLAEKYPERLQQMTHQMQAIVDGGSK